MSFTDPAGVTGFSSPLVPTGQQYRSQQTRHQAISKAPGHQSSQDSLVATGLIEEPGALCQAGCCGCYESFGAPYSTGITGQTCHTNAVSRNDTTASLTAGTSDGMSTGQEAIRLVLKHVRSIEQCFRLPHPSPKPSPLAADKHSIFFLNGGVDSRRQISMEGTPLNFSHHCEPSNRKPRYYTASPTDHNFTDCTKGYTGITRASDIPRCSGSCGFNGRTGTQGQIDQTGQRGALGFTGLKGSSQVTDSTGPQGRTGFAGPHTFQGHTGYTGPQGFTGYIEPPGQTGKI